MIADRQPPTAAEIAMHLGDKKCFRGASGIVQHTSMHLTFTAV